MKNYKEKSKESFDMQAKTYDETNYSKYPRESYPYVIKALSEIKFTNILDLSCGTGSVLDLLLTENPDIKAFGIDLSDEMLKAARKKLGTKAELLQGDAENLPYREESFDVVMCTESFHHYPNPEKALSEAWRVLKPSGKLILCDIWMFAPLRQIVNAFIKFGNKGDVKVYSEMELVKMLTESRFKNIHWNKAAQYTYICSGGK